MPFSPSGKETNVRKAVFVLTPPPQLYEIIIKLILTTDLWLVCGLKAIHILYWAKVGFQIYTFISGDDLWGIFRGQE